MPSWWATHKLKNNCIIDVLLQEISECPVRLPTEGVWHEKEEPPKHLVLKATGAWVQEFCRTGETITLLLEGTHKVSCVLGARVKEWLHRRLSQTCESPGKRGVICGSFEGAGTLVTEATGKIHQYELSWRSPFWHQRPGPTQEPTSFSVEMPQAKQPILWKHSPTHQQTGCLKCPETTAL